MRREDTQLLWNWRSGRLSQYQGGLESAERHVQHAVPGYPSQKLHPVAGEMLSSMMYGSDVPMSCCGTREGWRRIAGGGQTSTARLTPKTNSECVSRLVKGFFRSHREPEIHG